MSRAFLFQAAIDVDAIRAAERDSKQCQYETRLFIEKIAEARRDLSHARAEHGADSWQAHDAVLRLRGLRHGMRTLRAWRRILDARIAAPQSTATVRVRICQPARVNRNARAHRTTAKKPASTASASDDEPPATSNLTIHVAAQMGAGGAR